MSYCVVLPHILFTGQEDVLGFLSICIQAKILTSD